MENGIPSYLKPYVVETKEPKTFEDAFVVVGDVKCSCGTETFNVIREREERTPESREAEKRIEEIAAKYESEQSDGHTLCITSKQGRDYFAFVDFSTDEEHFLEDITELQKVAFGGPLTPIFLEAVCSRCSQRILIFDSRKHGYNGLIAETEKNYATDFKTRKKSGCRKCGNDTSEIIVKISNTGKDDLLSEQDGPVNNNNWEDAFDWLTVDLKCGGCGSVTKKYLDFETM